MRTRSPVSPITWILALFLWAMPWAASASPADDAVRRACQGLRGIDLRSPAAEQAIDHALLSLARRDPRSVASDEQVTAFLEAGGQVLDAALAAGLDPRAIGRIKERLRRALIGIAFNTKPKEFARLLKANGGVKDFYHDDGAAFEYAYPAVAAFLEPHGFAVDAVVEVSVQTGPVRIIAAIPAADGQSIYQSVTTSGPVAFSTPAGGASSVGLIVGGIRGAGPPSGMLRLLAQLQDVKPVKPAKCEPKLWIWPLCTRCPRQSDDCLAVSLNHACYATLFSVCLTQWVDEDACECQMPARDP